jgi:hypothetical protein
MFLMMHRVTIDVFGICHTRVIRSIHHVHYTQIFGVGAYKNILKNILKMSDIWPHSGILNTTFHFTHIPRRPKSYGDMNTLTGGPSIHHFGNSVMPR